VRFSNNDYQLFEKIAGLTQKQLHSTMAQFLQSKYDNVIITPEYIIAIGDIPIALVAHMDTVFRYPVRNLYYDSHKSTLWSSEGLGADDRAGVFAILQVLKVGLRPSIILTTDEETGGLGAAALVSDFPKAPIPDLKYLIELDRCGKNDAVFYCCISDDFKEYVEGFGFLEARGTFSDISILMPHWQVCGVNLSIGYQDEHTYTETLNIKYLYATVQKVITMLQEEVIPAFIFHERPPIYSALAALNPYDGFTFDTICACCNQQFNEYEVIPVKGLDGATKFYCPDCVSGNVEWCTRCGEAYELAAPIKKKSEPRYCNDCVGAKNETN